MFIVFIYMYMCVYMFIVLNFCTIVYMYAYAVFSTPLREDKASFLHSQIPALPLPCMYPFILLGASYPQNQYLNQITGT